VGVSEEHRPISSGGLLLKSTHSMDLASRGPFGSVNLSSGNGSLCPRSSHAAGLMAVVLVSTVRLGITPSMGVGIGRLAVILYQDKHAAGL
jgi:hypothetical protein